MIKQHLVLVERKSANEAVNALISEGLEEDKAVKMVSYASGAGANPGDDGVIEQDGGKSGVGDMLIGGLFCVGGIIATAADIGYIFWGAIVFGGIQFFRGLMKSLS